MCISPYPVLKVYISSTYRDLKEHRQSVIDFFHHLKEQFTVICMEGYVAEDKTPVQKCLEDVCNCDIYVLVLANRYGFISEDACSNPDRLSVTELEYLTAVKESKKLLAFFADTQNQDFEFDTDADAGLRDEKLQKLQQFKTKVRNKVLTHPEGFIAPFHLALQVAESMMQIALLKWKVEELRKYCCDRGVQFTDYLAFRSKSRFKVMVIKGETADLGLNLVNRFAIFTLNLTEQDVAPPVTFQDFLVSSDYEKCKTLFLVNIFFKFFQTNNLDPVSAENFVRQSDLLSQKPLVLVLHCIEKTISQNEMKFLQLLWEEFYQVCKDGPGNNLYFFLYIEEEKSREKAVDEKVDELLKGCTHAKDYLHVLPRLEEAHQLDIRKWLGSFITKDESRILDLFQLQFGALPEKFSMLDGERHIRKFIQRLNRQEQDILDILS
jgi:Domain of unknown function (DUF4062)